MAKDSKNSAAKSKGEKKGAKSTQKSSEEQGYKEMAIEEYVIEEEPFYIPTGDEIEVFKVAFKRKVPFAAIGPTGCGKTRFVQYMSWLLNKERNTNYPFLLVTCHEDLAADDMLGMEKITGEYQEGVLHRWARKGGILYLDEVVEARSDVVTLLHPLMEPGRRYFSNERKGTTTLIHPDCMLVKSYNPGYQDITKQLKPSTKQRPMTHRFGYAPPELEQKIVIAESGVDKRNAHALVEFGTRVRNMKDSGVGALQEGASTRLLINAGMLIADGIPPMTACTDGIINCLTEGVDDTYNKLGEALQEVAKLFYGK